MGAKRKRYQNGNRITHITQKLYYYSTYNTCLCIRGSTNLQNQSEKPTGGKGKVNFVVTFGACYDYVNEPCVPV